MGTAAEAWLEEGRAEGIAEGNSPGKVETFLRQASRKFGGVPASSIDDVRKASPRQLDAWLDVLITAPDIDTVLGSGAEL